MRNDNIKINDIGWNTLGTIAYAMVSLLLSVVVIRICGSLEGGIFSFGFSTLAHLVFIISFFGIRPMHIVDIKYRYSFKDYVRFGLKSLTVAIIAGVSYIAYRHYIGTYNFTKSILLIILVLHGAIDGFADYFESEYQRVNKLYMGGQSQFFRIIFFATSLILTLYITNDLLLSELVAIIIEIIMFYYLNIIRSKNVFKVAKFKDNNIRNSILFIEALPLFLITFLDFYIFASAKISIDANLLVEPDKYSGFFNLVFMPTNIIYLSMTLVMKPMLTPLSNAYHTSKKEYKKILNNTFIFAIVVASLSMLGAIVLGKLYFDLVNIVLGGQYEWTRSILVFEGLPLDYVVLLIVMFGGIFYTICTPMYFSIIIENKQKYLLITYSIVAIISLFTSKFYVKNEGVVGAAISFVISMFLLFVGIVIIRALTKNEKL